MRILPVAFIVIGALGVAKFYGLIPVGAFPLIGPLLLIALGVALLFRRSHHCHGRRRLNRSDTPQPSTAALN
ncbi:MAG: hypothetical protein R3E52_04810 [Burkholderiaceae bacterium]